MVVVTKYRCEHCGDLLNSEEKCLEHEARHLMIYKANELLEEGKTLKEINDETLIWSDWDKVPQHLENVTKDNCFTISYWQCCDKPAYQILYINFDGTVSVRGCGSWDGYYGNDLRLTDHSLRNPRPKEELFIDKRYMYR
jgi:hypothetical protein